MIHDAEFSSNIRLVTFILNSFVHLCTRKCGSHASVTVFLNIFWLLILFCLYRNMYPSQDPFSNSHFLKVVIRCCFPEQLYFKSIIIFWDMTLCSQVDLLLRGMYCLHLRGCRTSQASTVMFPGPWIGKVRITEYSSHSQGLQSFALETVSNRFGFAVN